MNQTQDPTNLGKSLSEKLFPGSSEEFFPHTARRYSAKKGADKQRKSKKMK